MYETIFHFRSISSSHFQTFYTLKFDLSYLFLLLSFNIKQRPSVSRVRWPVAQFCKLNEADLAVVSVWKLYAILSIPSGAQSANVNSVLSNKFVSKSIVFYTKIVNGFIWSSFKLAVYD